MPKMIFTQILDFFKWRNWGIEKGGMSSSRTQLLTCRVEMHSWLLPSRCLCFLLGVKTPPSILSLDVLKSWQEGILSSIKSTLVKSVLGLRKKGSYSPGLITVGLSKIVSLLKCFWIHPNPSPNKLVLLWGERSCMTFIWFHLLMHKGKLRSSKIQEHLKMASLSWGKTGGRLGEEVDWVPWSGEQWWFLRGFSSRKCVVFLALDGLTFQFETKFLEAGS